MIKTKDSKANIKHFIKKQSIRTRNTDKDTRQESISSNANVQATNSVKKLQNKHLLNQVTEQRNSLKKKEMNIKSRSKIH